jgi:hypothetical protein
MADAAQPLDLGPIKRWAEHVRREWPDLDPDDEFQVGESLTSDEARDMATVAHMLPALIARVEELEAERGPEPCPGCRDGYGAGQEHACGMGARRS